MNEKTISKCNVTGTTTVKVSEEFTIFKLNEALRMDAKIGGLACENLATGKIQHCENTSTVNIQSDNNILAMSSISFTDLTENLKKGTVTSYVNLNYGSICAKNYGTIIYCEATGDITANANSMEALFRLMGKLYLETNLMVGAIAAENSGIISNSVYKNVVFKVGLETPDLSWIEEQITSLYYSKHVINFYRLKKNQGIAAVNNNGAVIDNCVCL